MKNNKKGFTLAELLVVVGIIAVLIAIAIPVFTTQLETSREAVDAANIRSAYAELSSTALVGDTNPAATTKITYDANTKTWSKDVALKQTTANWQKTDFDWPANLTVPNEFAGSATFTLTYNNGEVTATVKSAS